MTVITNVVIALADSLVTSCTDIMNHLKSSCSTVFHKHYTSSQASQSLDVFFQPQSLTLVTDIFLKDLKTGVSSVTVHIKPLQ